MYGHRDYPQCRADEHHHRSFSHSGELSEELGMPGMAKPRAIEAVLMDRIGHERCGVPVADISDGSFNRAEDGWGVAGIGAPRLCMNHPADRRNWEGVIKDRERLTRSVDRA